MNFDDEKDLQQILFLAARILERRHNQTDGSAPSLIASPTNPDNPPQLSDDGKTIFFPALRDVREVTGSPAAEVNSQKEVSLTFSEKEIQHRLVYQIIEEEQTVKIIRMWTHYGDN